LKITFDPQSCHEQAGPVDSAAVRGSVAGEIVATASLRAIFSVRVSGSSTAFELLRNAGRSRQPKR
jgi:hypothetical protein